MCPLDLKAKYRPTWPVTTGYNLRDLGMKLCRMYSGAAHQCKLDHVMEEDYMACWPTTSSPFSKDKNGLLPVW